ncbi:MAG: T9SS C-terminal target domain-containing protein, partial [Ignavibacteriales bacterium]
YTASTFGYIFGNDITTSFRCFSAGAAGAGNITLRGNGITNINVTGVLPGPSVVHFVYDSSASEVRTYLNGVFQSAVAQTPFNLSAAVPFKVGGYGTATGIPAGSLLDEFRFYRRALGVDEIAATWNQTLPFVIPVELSSFTASVIGTDITLTWTTASETNNSGFEIERISTGEEKWEKIGFTAGFGTTTEAKSYSFTDGNVSTGVYKYRLKQVDFDGTFEYSGEVEVEVITPAEYSMEQNYPNPFNPKTQISFNLPEAGLVKLEVYNLLGQKVIELINQEIESGYHSIDFNANELSSSIYVYTISANNFVSSKKMILMK